ncbi:MAG: FeoA family protein [Bacteroidota bacterium]
MVSIADLKPGQKGVITPFDVERIPTKLLELGCLPGNTVELLQIAPLNDPIHIDLNGSRVAIRRSVAEEITLEIVENNSRK